MADHVLPRWWGRQERQRPRQAPRTAGTAADIRLGKAFRSTIPPPDPMVGGVVLLLPDGEPDSERGPSRWAAAR
nr:hypothetical protein [Streptomyces clavuligerus]